MPSVIKFIGRNFLTIAVLVIGIVIGGYLIGAAHNVRDFFFPETSAHVRINTIIVNSIKNIGQLVTVTSINTTDVKVDIHQGFLNSGYYSANHIAIGAIEAGIDFEQIDEHDISMNEDVYTLTLPPAIITSCRIEYINQNEYSFTLLGADWDLVRQLAEHDALIKFAEEMIEYGILERAANQAELLLSEFIFDLTGKTAHIKFASRNGEPELPQSCVAITPSGWAKDADGSWKREE